MKQIRLFLYISLLFPLLAVFSEASIVKSIDCSHCNNQVQVQQDCCTLDENMPMPTDCDGAEPIDKSCPHGGFCQGRDTIPVAVNQVSTPQASSITLTSHQSERTSALLFKYEQVASLRTSYTAPPLFLYHCSFLI